MVVAPAGRLAIASPGGTCWLRGLAAGEDPVLIISPRRRVSMVSFGVVAAVVGASSPSPSALERDSVCVTLGDAPALPNSGVEWPVTPSCLAGWGPKMGLVGSDLGMIKFPAPIMDELCREDWFRGDDGGEEAAETMSLRVRSRAAVVSATAVAGTAVAGCCC